MLRTCVVMLLLAALPVLADEPATPSAVQQAVKRTPFDHRWGLAGYALGWEGSYGAGGVGGRIRFEAFPRLGLELFGEALLVAVPRGLRHDHPIGFSLYVPFRVAERIRLRALGGMCVTPSFLHSEVPGAPRADTILLGAHLGGAADFALHERLSFFTELKSIVWWGNDRSVEGWTSASNDLRVSVLGQLALGFMVHFG